MIISQHGQTAVRSLTILDRFDRVAKQTECLTGHPVSFGAAACFIVIWAMIGPLFDFGDNWWFTLVAVTSVVTSLIVFLIQNNQSRTVYLLAGDASYRLPHHFFQSEQFGSASIQPKVQHHCVARGGV